MEDYPRSLKELKSRFQTEEACLDYLFQIRWPEGFICPRCGSIYFGQTKRALWHCQKCGLQTSITSGTIFHGTHKPLSLWFRVIWTITSQKYGTNALGLQRILDIGCYETAWQLLHKLRRAMVRPDRDLLSGCNEPPRRKQRGISWIGYSSTRQAAGNMTPRDLYVVAFQNGVMSSPFAKTDSSGHYEH